MLHVHRAERSDALLEALRAVLAEPPDDPLTPEVIAVPTKGIERWIAQRLAMALGVCANVRFPSPGRLIDDALAAASGIAPDEDPWRPERATWPLLHVVEDHLGEPWLRPLAAYLEQPERRLATVRHVAGLFERYAVHRPELLDRWHAGDDGGWQAELWRRLRAHLGVPGPAERLAPACARLNAEPQLADLPDRLAIFSLTRLPAARLRALDALAAHRDVHLHLLHPSAALWDRIAGVLPEGRATRRRDDQTGALVANRLLASWGQDARELQLVLDGSATPRQDHHHPVAHPADTLLARLQADVRDDRPPPDEPLEVDPADRSLAVHACHGRARQVEVLRDAILHLLADDPSLEPRDVLVMCPDIEAFAPLIHATFASAAAPDDDEDDPDDPPPGDRGLPTLHVRLADRAIRQTNPVLGVVARLLELATARMTASEVIDLADREPVRRRFRLDDDDLARIEGWVADAGVRWGLDAEHRAPFRLNEVEHGTWRRGLDRLLLGAAMTEEGERLVAGVLPLDDVGSGDIDLAGRLAELVARLQHACATLNTTQPIGAWADAIAEAADALTATAPQDAWQRTELGRVLDDVRAESAAHPDLPLSVAEVRDLLADRLAGRPTRANFRTGHLTFCTLHPMRAVPHRVVCLLGLDDEVFPRGAPRDGDDLLLDEPHVGDRDGRLEDRQLLLDALLSATNRLLITYSGRDERTNMRRPPAVPVGELLEVVGRTFRADVVHHHPLQPFDPRNFAPDDPWGFDKVGLAGARARTGPREEEGPFLDGPLQPLDEPVVAVKDLVRFAERPVRTFLRRRLGIHVGSGGDELEDALTVEVDPLERWAVGQRMLDAQLAGTPERPAILAELARGALPPGLLAKPAVLAVADDVRDLLACVRAVLGELGPAGSLDVGATLPGGRRLTGTVAGVAGDTVRFVTYSRLDPRHRLAAWVRLLALTAARPERPWRAATIGRTRRGGDDHATVSHAAVGPLDRAGALRHLAELVDLYDRGMREPVPIACRASAAYAAAARAERDPAIAAGRAWTSSFRVPGEDAEPEHELVFGGRLALDDLLALPPRADDPGDDPSRFGRLARALWAGLLEHERLEDR